MNGELVNEAGIRMSPQQILTGYALLEISAESDREVKLKVIKIARILSSLL